MKLTPWFTGNVAPVRPGVYERYFIPTKIVRYAYWNGSVWCVGGKTPKEALLYKKQKSAGQLKAVTIMWRGLAEEPK